MEVTNEIRCKIFALYLGCKCISNPNGEEPQQFIINGETLMAMELYPKVSDDLLLLKNISSITDEDAIRCGKIYYNNDYSADYNDMYKRQALSLINDEDIPYNIVDYLRSKGYMLPAYGITDLFEAGIATPSTITDKSK